MLDQSSPLLHAPLQPEGKNAFALKRLRRAILDCELLPASNPSEGDIATRFGLGRAAVRNALARLAVEGFVSPNPRNGWQVAPISGATIGDVLDACQILEPQLALVALSSEQLAELRLLSTQHSALSSRKEAEAVTAARTLDRKILCLLAARRGAIVAQWTESLLDHTSRLLAYFEAGHPSYVARSRDRLIDSLEAGDSAAAEAELKAEVLQFREYLIARLLRSTKLATAADPDDAKSAEPAPAPTMSTEAEKFIRLRLPE